MTYLHAWQHLQVRTYDVVPVSSSLGLVEFVPGTQPLKSAIMAFIEPEVCWNLANFADFIASAAPLGQYRRRPGQCRKFFGVTLLGSTPMVCTALPRISKSMHSDDYCITINVPKNGGEELAGLNLV